jgi:hypothetical protein
MFIENMNRSLCDPEGVVSNVLDYSSINITLLRSEQQNFEDLSIVCLLNPKIWTK